MTTSSPTVFELVDEVIAPLTRAVPRRLSVMQFYDPDADPASPPGLPLADLAAEAARHSYWHDRLAELGLSEGGRLVPGMPELLDAMRRGDVRGVLTGVFAGRPEPVQVQFFGGKQHAALISRVGDQAVLRTGSAEDLVRLVLEQLPDRPPGRGDVLRLDAGPLGVLGPECAAEVAHIRELGARPRLGTVLVDLSVGDKVVANHPGGTYALLDTADGRHALAGSVDCAGNWSLLCRPISTAKAGEWLAESIHQHEEPGCF
ncbi:ESX secretion-associated protein EspG [Amycolatopsis nigrescens]|uniref:ESX secretion-associated protein EspG n=1 Tax=Amycolatopsis nigrescens TaxID=381445 RepID=UPI0003A8E18B|nr:ESX secretion-associated protein EspG [Amycolatopsis nigrescens]